MAGRHAKQPRHAKPDTKPPLFVRMFLFLVVIVTLGTFLPVLLGFGLAIGILFGWLGRAITRT